jgi:hypothetical protein
MSSGSDVAAYLRNELDEYTYRDENRKIRVNTDAPTDTDAADGDGTRSEHGGAAGQETNATPPARETDPEADEVTDDVTDTDPSDNPVFGNVDPDADPDAGLAADDSVELPCGCESYEPTEAPAPPFAVTCSTCGTSYRVTPDGDESETDDDRVELPCGCESFDPAEAPDEPLVVSCGTCGERYQVTA